jgi:hypothetical protein
MHTVTNNADDDKQDSTKNCHRFYDIGDATVTKAWSIERPKVRVEKIPLSIPLAKCEGLVMGKLPFETAM